MLFTKTDAAVGDYVYQPSDDGGTALGPIQDGAIFANKPYTYLLNNVATTTNCFLDAGVARINIDSVCCGSTCSKDSIKTAPTIDGLNIGSNTITDVRNLLVDTTVLSGNPLAFQPFKVFKVGRTTRLTAGMVKVINYPSRASINPWVKNSPQFSALNMIQIDFDPTDPSSTNGKNGNGQVWFADHGDSGSLVVDAQGRAVGILSSVAFPPLADGVTPDPTKNAPAFACHILPVLDHLNVCISSAGASPGSSSAPDGTGRGPVATPLTAQSELPSGEIVFTSQDVATPPISFSGAPLPKLNEDEVQHMRELLAAFRSTRLGPELHAALVEVRREIAFLVRNSRPVKVAWHRYKGPAYLAHVLNHLAGHSDSVPHEVQGVTRRALLVRMREVLSTHGSNPLRHALERYGDDLLEMFTREDCDNAEDCLAWLQDREFA